jgi:hypothetical protein
MILNSKATQYKYRVTFESCGEQYIYPLFFDSQRSAQSFAERCFSKRNHPRIEKVQVKIPGTHIVMPKPTIGSYRGFASQKETRQEIK